MSWFGKSAIHPILKHVHATVIFGAEVEGGKLARLCYTGHNATGGAVVQAVAPGHGTLWRADLAEEDDLRDGHVARRDGILVSREKHGSNHDVIARELWTGKERWRKRVPRMVTRMGIEHDGRLVFVTFDHQVHDIDIATGEDRPRPPVMTDQAADAALRRTMHPMPSWSSGGGRAGEGDWSRVFCPAPGLEVYERDWAGTREFGVGMAPEVQLIGAGSYEGSMQVGQVTVLGFKLDQDDARHHHWHLYATNPVTLLAVLREDGRSQLFEHGHAVWQGKL
jgi:hypothetical protein